MNFFQAIAWILFRINWRARIFSLRENFFGYLARPPISFLMVRPLVLRKSRTRSRQHLCQLKRSLYLCEDTVGVLFIHFSMNLSTLSLAAWISLVRWLWHLSLWTIDNSRSYGVTLQMKATEQFFFLWCCLLWCTKSPWFCLLSFSAKSYGVTIQMKATEQYFHNTVLIVFFTEWNFKFFQNFDLAIFGSEWWVSEWWQSHLKQRKFIFWADAFLLPSPS